MLSQDECDNSDVATKLLQRNADTGICLYFCLKKHSPESPKAQSPSQSYDWFFFPVDQEQATIQFIKISFSLWCSCQHEPFHLFPPTPFRDRHTQTSMGPLPENLTCTGLTFCPIRRMLLLTPWRPAFTFSGY